MCEQTKSRFTSNFLVFLAMGVGLATGWLEIPFLNQAATHLSDLFLRLLKLISLPIIFLAITSTMTGMKSFHEMRSLGRRVLVYTLGTTLVAATLALGIYLLVDPTSSAAAITSAPLFEGVGKTSYFSFLLNIVPSNIIQVFLDNNVMGIAFIGFLLSGGVLALPSEQKSFLNKLFSSLFATMLKVTHFIIKLMPIAVWAFVTLLWKDLHEHYEHFNNLLLYLGCVVGANLIQGIVILPLFLKWRGVPIWKSFKGMLPALTLAFFFQIFQCDFAGCHAGSAAKSESFS